MKKIDKLLKKASVYEDLAYCETKQAMNRVLNKHAQSGYTNPSGDVTEFTGDVDIETISPKTTAFTPPASLNNKNEVMAFQRNLLGYVAKDPNFNHILTKSLGSAWSQKDVDGIRGPRTSKALELYKQYTKSKDPARDLTKKKIDEEKLNTQYVKIGTDLLNKFRSKLKVIRQKIAQNTENFSKKYNVSKDKVQAAWTPFIQQEYGQLQAAYKNFPPELQREFTNLAQYMDQLFGGYMKAPPQEPKTLITLDAYDKPYTPTGI